MYLNSCRSTGESNKSASSFVLNSRAGGLQQVVDAANEPGTLRGVSMADLMHGRSTATIQTLKQLFGSVV